MSTPLTRRNFLSWTGGLVVSGALTRHLPMSAAGPARRGGATGERVLVLVQLNGGNDGLNTLVPAAGAYHDARPTLALADNEVIDVGLDGYALHGAMAPLVDRWRRGQVAAVHGVGFAEPNRSHFVSMDRWARADQMQLTTGWLGRWADTLAGGFGPLDAVALAGGAPVAVGARIQPAVVLTPAGLRFPAALDAATLQAMATPPAADELVAAIQEAYTRTVGAVQAFDRIVTADPEEDTEVPPTDGAAGITATLQTAAQIIAHSPTTRLVVVNAGGFDTHADQLAEQKGLLADLATGVAAYLDALDRSGDAARVVTVAISEFGRRVAENASGGTDHGAGGLALAFGPAVHGGLYGGVDFGSLLDGDVAPVVPTAALLTACADWIGADAATVLGGRDDSLRQLIGGG